MAEMICFPPIPPPEALPPETRRYIRWEYKDHKYTLRTADKTCGPWVATGLTAEIVDVDVGPLPKKEETPPPEQPTLLPREKEESDAQ